MNKIKKVRRWSFQCFKRIKKRTNWVAVIVITVLLNLASIIDGDWVNWKMNLGIVLLIIFSAYYD